MAEIRFRHAGVVVRDMQRSLQFYRDWLGLRVMSERRETGSYIDSLLGLSSVDVWWVKLGGAHGEICVELLQYRSPHGAGGLAGHLAHPGCSHIAFTVDALDELYGELRARGVTFTTQPLVSPDGTVKVTFCEDPDGAAIELVQLLG